MKQMKKTVLALLLIAMVMLSCGCGVKNETSMNTDGKGRVSFRIGFKKGSIEDTKYTNFDTIEELADKIQELIDDETGLKVTTDTTSSKKDDYILVSYDYDNLEKYKDNISTVIQKYNMMVVADDVNGMYGYNPFDMNSTNEWECEALAEYLGENGIDADKNDRNVRKFIKLLIKDMYIGFETEYEDDEESYMEEEMKKRFSSQNNKNNDELIPIDESELENYTEYTLEEWDAMQQQNEEMLNDEMEFVQQPDVEIVERGGEKYLKIKNFALGYIEMYVRKLLDKNAETIFDTEYVKQSSYFINGKETKEIFKKTFECVDLATDIKKILKEKIGEDATNYSMKDFSPVLTVKLLTEDYVKALNKEYNREHNAYQELKAEDDYSMEVDVLAELYNERDTKYEMTFGENTALVDSENMYDYMDEDGYFVLSDKKDAGIEVKEHNNVAYEDLDEAPEAGDSREIAVFIIIAVFCIILMIIAACNFVRKEKH